MNRQLLVILGVLGLYAWAVGGWARSRAQRSAQLRILLLWGAVLALPAGVYIAFFLPEQIPFNRESPGGIFTVYIPCFVVWGGLAFGGLGAQVAVVVAVERSTGRAGIGVVAGGALGALLGAITQVYRWRPLGTATVGLSAVPSGRVVGGGVGIGMRIPLR